MTVWVTRDETGDGPLSTALRTRGLSVVLEPVVERRVVTSALEAIGQLGPDDWLVLTSAYAIEAAACDAARIPKVAVVGESSRRAAAARGLRVALVNPRGAAGLFEQLRANVTRGKVCYPRSSAARAPQPWSDIVLHCPVLYETANRAFDRGVIGKVDVVAVASPSAVRAVGPADLPFASIGPTTSAAIRELGREPWLEAPTPGFEALAAAIAAQANDSRDHRA